MRGSPARTALAVLLGAGAVLPAQETPTFRSDAQVVLLDLVARDRKGQPVVDLRADEVQVFEDGTRCEVASFRLVRAPGKGEAAPAPAIPTSKADTPETATPSRANLVVLVFDTLPVATAPLARQGALDLLSREFPANTWFAVYKIDRSMRLLQAFTSDRARLASAVDFATTGDDARRLGPATSLQSLPETPAAPIEPSGGPTRPDTPPNPDLAGIGGDVQRYLGELADRVQAFDSLYGLLAVARSLEAVRGRKSILYFGEAREVPTSVSSVYDTTIGEANRANVTIHTVDARGLSASRPGGRNAFDEMIGSFSAQGATRAADTGGRVVIPKAAGPATIDLMADYGLANPLQGSFLERIAQDTGGLAIADTNDLGRGLGRVVEELGQYYEVVYVPPNPVPDGRFRRIEAKVSRPGVRVRTRAGYFATAASAPGLLAYEMPLLAALGASAPSRDFAHHAGVLHFGVKGREREAVFLAQVPLADVRLAADEARGVYRGHLTLLGLVKDEAGRPVARITHDWPIEGPLAERDRTRRASAVFRRTLTLPPGRHTLETAVQDRETGALSVSRSSFVIADTPPGSLALGSLCVVRRAEPAAAQASDDPLRVAGVSIQPELGTPVLPRSTREIPLVLLVYPTLASGAAELHLELLRDGQPVAQARPALPAPEPDGRIAWVGGLPARSLAPGRYEVVATVRAGDESAEERAAFEIAAGAAADTAASAPTPVPPDLVPVLERAARYVLDYEQSLHDIAAEEEYTQWALRMPTDTTGITLSCTTGACRRTTRADVVFVRLGGAIPWGTFRDVFEVDGQKVRDREARLEALFSASSPASVVQRARAILNESARYNIGPAMRNINFPTLSLAFLLPVNQNRFAWKRGGTRRFGTAEGIEVQFQEVARPTLVDQDGRGDLPAKGRFWIDATRGTVLRSETEFRFEPARARASVATQYRAEPRLAMWVPSEMREEYEDLPGAPMPVFRSPSEATARYSSFRKFTVTIEDATATVPSPR